MLGIGRKLNAHKTVFIVNFEHILHLFLVFLLLTLNISLPAGLWPGGTMSTNEKKNSVIDFPRWNLVRKSPVVLQKWNVAYVQKRQILK